MRSAFRSGGLCAAGSVVRRMMFVFRVLGGAFDRSTLGEASKKSLKVMEWSREKTLEN
jgi:hypothetical protein